MRAGPHAEAERQAHHRPVPHPPVDPHPVRRQPEHQPEGDRRRVEELLAHAEPHRRRRAQPHEQPGQLGLALGEPAPADAPHQHGVDHGQHQRREAHGDDRPPEDLEAHRHREELDGAAVALPPEERREAVVAEVAGHQRGDDLVGVGPAQRRQQDHQAQGHPGATTARGQHGPPQAGRRRTTASAPALVVGPVVGRRRAGRRSQHRHGGRFVGGVGAHGGRFVEVGPRGRGVPGIVEARRVHRDRRAGHRTSGQG